MATVPTDPEYCDTKCVIVRDGEGTEHTLKIDRFNAEGSEPLSKAGYGGVNHQFTLMSAGSIESHYDPHKMAIDSAMMRMNACAEDMCKAIHHGEISWHSVEDGEVYSLEDIQELRHGPGR